MNIDIFFVEKGCGFPLILLHGNGEDHSYFEKQIEFFSKKFRVIALDTRGHGKTPRGEQAFTISQFTEDLHEFILKQGIEKAHVLGFSDGGNIALKFVLKYPDFVDRLILNGANLAPDGVKRSVQLPIEIGYKFAKLFAEKSEGAKRNAEMLGLMVNDPYIDAEALTHIGAKTLVIAGTRDMILEEHTRFIARMIPDAQLVFLKGDHFIANKNPDEFNKVVDEFLHK